MELNVALQFKYWHFVFCIIACLAILSPTTYAMDGNVEDEIPEEDLSATDNQALNEDEVDIPIVSFSHAEGEPVLDGGIDEVFWDQSTIFEIDLELYPVRYGKPQVETFVRVAVTSSHIFIAFDARDPKPEMIRSAAQNHDAVKDDDYVSLIIDPSGAGIKKYEFRINPHGSLTDVLQDTVADRYFYDWDTDWTGSAQKSELGYTAEIAIPHQSIKFPVQDIKADDLWLMMFKRSYPRSIDRTFGKVVLVKKADSMDDRKGKSNISAPQGKMTVKQLKEFNKKKFQRRRETSDSQSDTVNNEIKSDEKEEKQAVLPAAKAGKRNQNKLQSIDFTPHYIFHKDEERDIGDTPFKQDKKHGINEFGFTSKMHFGTNKSLAVTVNPNFTEVESDIARESINNSFNPFKPEKRSFFHSGAELYNTMLPMVYTRNIKLPEGGVSYAQNGRASSGGFFYVKDRETEFIMPDNLGSDKVNVKVRSDATAARFQKILGKKSIGALATYREGEDNYHNFMGGFDGVWDLGIDDKMRFQMLYSDTRYPESFADDLCEEGDCTVDPIPEDCPLGSCGTTAEVLRTNFDETLTGHALRLNYKHDGPNGLYWFNFYDVHEDFRADLGYTTRVDFRSLNFAYGQKWYVRVPGDDGDSRIRSYLVFKEMESQEGEQIERSYTFLNEFRGWQQTVLRFGPTWKERAVNRLNQNSLELGDNAPLFDELYFTWYYEVSPTGRWTFNFDGRVGEMADAENIILGDIKEFKPRFRYRFDNFHFDLKGTYRTFDVTGGELYEEQFYTLGVTYRKNKNISHRMLFLHDITKRNLDLWTANEPKEEIESSFEYTMIYTPDNFWKVLAGVKLLEEKDTDKHPSIRDLTEREFFVKVERKFNLALD